MADDGPANQFSPALSSCQCPNCAAPDYFATEFMSDASAAPAFAGAASLSAPLPDPLASIIGGGAYRWNLFAPMGTPVTVTYSFMESRPSDNRSVTGFHAMTDEQRGAARSILSQFEQACGVRFLEVSDAGSGGDLRMGTSEFCTGFTYLPDVYAGRDFLPGSGNLYIGSSLPVPAWCRAASAITR